MTTFTQPVPELPVADLERAREYYCRCLGFERRWSFPEIASVARGEVAIFFRRANGAIAPQAFWVHAPDLEGAFEEMRGAGALIVEPPADKPWGLRQFTVRDVDGHVFYFHREIPRADGEIGAHP